VGRRWQC